MNIGFSLIFYIMLNMTHLPAIALTILTIIAFKIHKTNIHNFISNYELVNNLNSIKNGFK